MGYGFYVPVDNQSPGQAAGNFFAVQHFGKVKGCCKRLCPACGGDKFTVMHKINLFLHLELRKGCLVFLHVAREGGGGNFVQQPGFGQHKGPVTVGRYIQGAGGRVAHKIEHFLVLKVGIQVVLGTGNYQDINAWQVIIPVAEIGQDTQPLKRSCRPQAGGNRKNIHGFDAVALNRMLKDVKRGGKFGSEGAVHDQESNIVPAVNQRGAGRRGWPGQRLLPATA